jgi:hypothetical protein
VFTVPFNALPGLTGMRIRSRVTAGVNDSTSACDQFGTGETEDYRVTINAGPTGIAAGLNSRVNAAPNPVNDLLSLSGMKSGDELLLCDLSGKVMLAEKLTTDGTHTLSLQKVSAGMYILTVKNPAEGGVQSLRIIKQ